MRPSSDRPPVLGTLRSSASVRDVLAAGSLTSLYQPIVDLESGAVVGVEALARGPEGPLYSPDALFAAAKEEGLLAELDWACRASALSGALACGLPEGVALFVNVEPATLGGDTPPDLVALEAEAEARFTVVLELTERELVRRPAEVLAAVRRARSQGWHIALDDVGVEPASLALMPVVRPDVVKLDMRLIQGRSTVAGAQVLGAVGAYAEESGAVILTEGIEDRVHLERALVAGATLGQGWRFGRPEAIAQLSLDEVATGHPAVSHAPEETASTPFQMLGPGLPVRQGRKSQLLATSLMLEGQGVAQPIPPLLLSTFQDSRFVTPATKERYARYAQSCPLVAMIGVDLSEEPAPGARGAHLDPSDPLKDEWIVVVLSPHYAAALVARDMGEPLHVVDRQFEFAVTYDRRKVTSAAACLMGRITPSVSSS